MIEIDYLMNLPGTLISGIYPGKSWFTRIGSPKHGNIFTS